jgi:hypothetical protein
VVVGGGMRGHVACTHTFKLKKNGKDHKGELGLSERIILECTGILETLC